MAKYHFNPYTGDPGKCRAKKGQCPYGDSETEHFDTSDDAAKAYEALYAPLNQIPEKRENTYDWPERKESQHREFSSLRTPGGKITMSIGACDWGESDSRTMELWLDVPGKGTVAFMKLIYRDPSYHPGAGAHLAMCDIETRPDSRGQGLARELRESVEAQTGLLIYSSGSYTPEGWAAFGKHGRHLPNPYASRSDLPGEKFRSMGFVASWKDKVAQDMDRTIDHTEEQRDAAWRLSDEGVFEKFRNKEILWAED